MRRWRGGQSTVELALAVPFIFGLLVLTLQAGLVISDQVQLEHYAYEGALWASAHRSDAGVDNTAIQNHVTAQLCGGSTTIPAAGGSRFCRQAPSGIANVQVAVGSAAAPVAARSWTPVMDAEAAGGACQTWGLAITPATQVADPQASPPDTAVYTVSLVNIGAPGATDVDVILSGGKYPATLASTPTFDPPSLNTGSSSARTSTLRIPLRADTLAGTYNIYVSGYDRCPNPQVFATYANLVVKPGLPSVPPAGNISVDSVLSSVLPLYICIASDLTITGHNFRPGATVKVGRDLATSVTYVGVDTLVAHFTGMPSAGVGGIRQDLTVTNPDGTSATMVNAVTVQQGTCSSVNTNDDCVAHCETCVANCTGCVSKCTGVNCVTGCGGLTCTQTCGQPLCITSCNNQACTASCSQPRCVSGCNNHGCVNNCDASSCVHYCDNSSCAFNCKPPINCIDSCSTGTLPTANNGCAGGAGAYLLTVTITYNEPLVIPWLTGGPTSPWIPLTARQKIVCQ